MNLSEAKLRLRKEGYQLKKLNECGPSYDYRGCGAPARPTPRREYTRKAPDRTADFKALQSKWSSKIESAYKEEFGTDAIRVWGQGSILSVTIGRDDIKVKYKLTEDNATIEQVAYKFPGEWDEHYTKSVAEAVKAIKSNKKQYVSWCDDLIETLNDVSKVDVK